MENEVNWTNNVNDTQTDATIQFLINNVSHEGAGQTDITVDEFVQTDPIDGSVNWKVGDEFTIAGNAQVYTITVIGFTGSGGDLTIERKGGVAGGLAAQANNNVVCSKEDSYKGNQGSAENHLRLRNMGII
tara:strand:+ start:345 stop:737 length:393 start_codon:yes stop_codon:yes gene_type:complete